MADVNQQAQDLAEIMERVNDEMRRFGRITEETQDALKAGSFRRAKELDQASKLTADALGSLAGAGLAAGKAMYNGEKGAAAFNDALDSMSKAVTAAGAALTFLMPGGFLVKALVGLGTAAVGVSLKMTQAANTMADQLFAANTKMAKSGAAASDGLTGMFRDAKKLGLSMKELGVYTDAVAANSAELALFKGTAFEGRKAFVNIGEAMKPFRANLEAAGISLEDQIEGLGGYLRLQTRIGQSQNKTTEELATGARKYLIEMDGLSKLTGMQRQEIEKQIEAALSEQRFRAKLDAMRATKDPQQMAAADKLMRANILISKQAPEMGQAFRDATSGVLTSDASVKGLISSQGKLLEVTAQLTSGQIDEYQATKQLGGSIEDFNKALNFTAQLGLLNDFAIDYAQGQQLAIFAQKDISELAKVIQEEQNKQLGAQNDASATLLANLRAKERDLNEKAETAIFNTINTSLAMGHALANVTSPLLDAFAALSPAVEGVTKLLVKALNWLAPNLNSIVGSTVDIVEATQQGGMGGFYRAGGAEAVGTVAAGGIGAVKGAAVGAALGSTVPVVGTIIGGILGALVGGGAGGFFGKYTGKLADYGGTLITPEPSTPPGRAAGGPVSRRNPYIVGERGPELMVPEQSGNIVNNDQLTKMMAAGNNVNNLMAKMSTSGTDINATYKSIARSIGDFSQEHDLTITNVSGDITSIENTTENVDKTYQAILKTVDEFSDKNKNITTSMITTQRDTLLQSEKIENLTEQNARRTKDFSTFYGQYIDKMTKALDEDLESIAGGTGTGAAGEGGGSAGGGTGGGSTGGFISRLMNAIGVAGGAGSAGGAGGEPPVARSGPEPHGAPVGQGGAATGSAAGEGKPQLARVGSKSGKSTMVNAEYAPKFQGIIDYLDSVGYKIYSLGGYVDRDVRGQPGVKSVHAHGGAIDINPAENPFGSQLITDMPADIGQVAARMGLGWGGNWRSIKDAMHFSVAKNEGGTVDFSAMNTTSGAGKTPQAKKGGILSGPKSGFNAILHDIEAVVPLPDGKTIPVDMKGQINQDIMTKISDMSSKITALQKPSERDIASQISDMTTKIDAMQQFGLNLQNNMMGDGGITQGPSIAGEAGPEAVIPLKNGTVPVKIDLRNLQDIGPTFFGMNEYTGYNAGPMSTDLSVIKEIAASMGAFDKASQTITDPATWKEILASGIAMNYDLGVAKIGTQMIPNIGQEMTQRMSEIVAEKGVDQMEAFRIMGNEFKEAMMSAMPQLLERMAPTDGTIDLKDSLDQLIAKQSEANDISKKILQVSVN